MNWLKFDSPDSSYFPSCLSPSFSSSSWCVLQHFWRISQRTQVGIGTRTRHTVPTFLLLLTEGHTHTFTHSPHGYRCSLDQLISTRCCFIAVSLWAWLHLPHSAGKKKKKNAFYSLWAQSCRRKTVDVVLVCHFFFLISLYYSYASPYI